MNRSTQPPLLRLVRSSPDCDVHDGGTSPMTTSHVACDRPDLTDWAARGGPLPLRLAAHVTTCPACAGRVRRVNQVHASLMLLRTQAAPPDLLARANGRAMRFLRRATRASQAAQRLLSMRPNLTFWQRTQIHLARMSIGAAAAALALLMRAGVLAGIEQTREAGEQLVAAQWEHIDPHGQSFGPRSLT